MFWEILTLILTESLLAYDLSPQHNEYNSSHQKSTIKSVSKYLAEAFSYIDFPIVMLFSVSFNEMRCDNAVKFGANKAAIIKH